MQCAKTPSECYMRYHTYCEGYGLPSYGMPAIICSPSRDDCRCVRNASRGAEDVEDNAEIGLENRATDIIHRAAEPVIFDDEALGEVAIRYELNNYESMTLMDQRDTSYRMKGVLNCPMPADQSECHMRYHRTCEQGGFLPGPSMATIICFDHEGCTCDRI